MMTRSLNSLKFLLAVSLLSIALKKDFVRGEDKSTSPILSSQFEASLAASATRGSAIAVSFNNKIGAVVLTTTSGDSGSENSLKLQQYEEDMKDSLSITKLSPSIHCCMTGLTCDVEHLRKCWAQELLVQRDYYLVSGVDKWIRTRMAQPLKESCWTRGRPFGVQALIISAQDCQNPRLHTIDPSGQVHTWHGGGTAIGKDARIIRDSLHELLSKENSCVDSWEDACHVAMKALLSKKENDFITVQGMVIQSGNLPSFTIPQKILQKHIVDCQLSMKSM